MEPTATPPTNVTPPPVPPSPPAPTPAAAAPTPPAPPTPVAPPIAPASTPLPSVPDTWPGATGLYKYSKQVVKVNLRTVVTIWLLDLLISSIIGWKFSFIGHVIALIIGSLATAAYTFTYLASLRGEKMSIGQALSSALPVWLKMIGLTILIAVSIIVSVLLLIVPFFFVLPRLTLSPYFLIDKKMGVLEAYKASWHATKGNVGKVWGIILLTIAMALLFITIIGIPFSIYFLIMYNAAFVVLYKFLEKAPTSAAPAAVTPATPPVVPSTPSPVQ
jgi:hypothetical protein